MKLSSFLKELNKATLHCPCPKCGKYDGIVVDEKHDEKSDTYYRVRCKACDVHPAEWSSGMVEAVSDWHEFCEGNIMINELDEETKKELSEAFGRINQAFDKMDEQFKEMTGIIDKSLEAVHDLEDVKVMIVKDSWKNTVIERIMYFLIGGAIGFAIHYYLGL